MPINSPISPKILVILIIPVILLLALVSALYFIQPPIPNQMNLSLQTIDGNTIHTTDFKGKILVVEFMATWCDYCSEIAGNIANILANKTVPNVMFLSVTIDPTHDTGPVLTTFINDNHLENYALNGTQWMFTRDLTQQYSFYGVSNVPTTFLVGNNSVIIDHHLGYITSDFIMSWLQTAQTA